MAEEKSPGDRGFEICFECRIELGGDDADLPLSDLLLRAEPVIEIVAVFSAACLIEFMRAVADLFFEISQFTLNRHR